MLILCKDQTVANFWHKELKSSGIPVSIKKRKFSNWYNRLDKAILFIDPEIEEVNMAKNLSLSYSKKVFILSDNPQWANNCHDKPIYVLPRKTHPLEMARFLVEKLSLSLESSQATYAYSIFTF
ncbi:MAG: hypothetical protein ACOVP6_10160 [Lacibacter sp.]